jgi:hypothetical protein
VKIEVQGVPEKEGTARSSSAVSRLVADTWIREEGLKGVMYRLSLMLCEMAVCCKKGTCMLGQGHGTSLHSAGGVYTTGTQWSEAFVAVHGCLVCKSQAAWSSSYLACLMPMLLQMTAIHRTPLPLSKKLYLPSPTRGRKRDPHPPQQIPAMHQGDCFSIHSVLHCPHAVVASMMPDGHAAHNPCNQLSST